MKFMQKISPTVYQFRCKYCGCPINICLESVEAEEYMQRQAAVKNPALIDGKPSFTFLKGG